MVSNATTPKERDGWLVRDERISWADWLKRQAA